MTKINIGTDTNYGKIYASKEVNGVLYYFMRNKKKSIMMMPASALEKEMEKE